jgi:hypothetical protein
VAACGGTGGGALHNEKRARVGREKMVREEEREWTVSISV